VIADLPLPGNATGAPMTYRAGGAQYIAKRIRLKESLVPW
jgi:hypothetical protein